MNNLLRRSGLDAIPKVKYQHVALAAGVRVWVVARGMYLVCHV